jgi:hypothetical protein
MSKDTISVQYQCEDRLGSILQTGTIVMTAKGKTYYFLPYWFELDKKSGDYTAYGLDKLPDDLVEAIKEMRK